MINAFSWPSHRPKVLPLWRKCPNGEGNKEGRRGTGKGKTKAVEKRKNGSKVFINREEIKGDKRMGKKESSYILYKYKFRMISVIIIYIQDVPIKQI